MTLREKARAPPVKPRRSQLLQHNDIRGRSRRLRPRFSTGRGSYINSLCHIENYERDFFGNRDLYCLKKYKIKLIYT